MASSGHGKEPDIQTLTGTFYISIPDIIEAVVILSASNQKDRNVSKLLKIEEPHIRRGAGRYRGPENAMMHGRNIKCPHAAHGIAEKIPMIRIDVIGFGDQVNYMKDGILGFSPVIDAGSGYGYW